MAFQTIDQSLVSEDIEEITVKKLKKAYTRYKGTTSQFYRKNVRDPLDYLDFELNIDNELDNLLKTIARGDYHPKRPLVHYSPKKNGISRPIVNLHIEDTIVYRFCIESIDEELIAITRQENIRGGVMASPKVDPDEGDYYEKWFKDWMAHNRALKDALEPDKYLATSDVTSYFDNIEIEVLVDMLREAVKGKRNLISLLSLFLHGIKLRYTYSTRLNTGLVQDDSDGSRILAYFYLHQHDIRMINFAKQHNGYFFRYADDMNVVVNTEVEAKHALRTLSDSLRKLGLTASVEKTEIVPAKKAFEYMRYKENEDLINIENAINERLRTGGQTKVLKKRLIKLYDSYKKRKLDKQKNWIKLLKRFYTFATYLKDDFLFDEISGHLLEYPVLVAEKKLHRYFIANQDSPKLSIAVSEVLKYLDSDENIYPQVETELIELLASLDQSKFPAELKALVHDFAYRIFKEGWKGHKESLSDFAFGVSAYLLFRCDPKMADEIAVQYITTKQESEYIRKCWAFVALACNDVKLRNRVISKLKAETSIEMSRLAYMMSNLKTLRRKKVMKDFCSNSEFFLWRNVSQSSFYGEMSGRTPWALNIRRYFNSNTRM